MRNKNKEVKELKKHKSLIGSGMPRSARMKNLRGTEDSSGAVIQKVTPSKDIIDGVVEIIKDKSGIEPTNDTKIADLGLDSFDVVLIQEELEEKFNISVPDYEFKTVGSIIDYVAENKK